MEGENNNEGEGKEQNRKQSLEKLEGLQADIADIRHTVENRPHDAKRKATYLSKQNIHLVVLGGIASMFGYFWFLEDMTMPPWVRVVAITTVVGFVVAYPYAKYVVDYLVEDTRIPLFTVNENNGEGIGLWWVPKERVNEISYLKGEPHKVTTNKGEGIEVLHFDKIEEHGEEHLYAEGTWLSEVPASEVKRKHSAIQSMRNNLVPLAQYGYEVKVQWPSLIHKLQSDVANSIIYEFQPLVNYRGGELQEEVDRNVDPEKDTNGMTQEEYENVRKRLRSEN